MAMPSVMAAHSVGQNSGPIFVHLWARVHLVMSELLARNSSLQQRFFNWQYLVKIFAIKSRKTAFFLAVKF